MMIDSELTERMKAALGTGDAAALGTLLASWPSNEIKALVLELDESYRRAVLRLERRYYDRLAQLGGDAHAAEREELDYLLGRARHDLAEIFDEIAGVALACLRGRHRREVVQ
jgi:hypothetical protein